MAQGQTVLNAWIACGVDNEVQFMDESQAERSADDIVDNLFATCLEMTFKELDDHFRAYSYLSVAQGHIRLRPGMRKKIKSLVQWTRNESRLGRDPAIMPFPVDQVSDLICC